MKNLQSIFRLLVVFFLILSGTLYAKAAADSSGAKTASEKYMLILSKAEKAVVVLNYQTLERITSIPVGADPHEVVTNPEGSLAYVSRPEMNDQGHNIVVLDLKKLQVSQTIDTRPFYIPHGLSYYKDQLWFTAQGSKAVAVYDIKQHKVEQVFGTGQDFTHLIYVQPDGKAFYTTNVESGTVSIFKLEDLPPYMPLRVCYRPGRNQESSGVRHWYP